MNTADEKTVTHTLSDESKVKITVRSDKDINDAAVLLEQIHDDKLPTINVRLWLNVLYLVVLPASIIATVLSRNTILHRPITIGSIIILFVGITCLHVDT